MNKTELCKIMEKNQSDKAPGLSGHHNYTLEYSRIFKNIKDNASNIFELGLGTNNTDIPSNMGENGKPGASLYGWKEYFLNAHIYGADIDSRILFSDDRISTFYVDQTNSETIDILWTNEKLKNIQFDIMIDDGLHELDANINFLKHSIHKLKPFGIYIIEDIIFDKINDYIRELNYLKEKNNFTYIIKILENKNNSFDNCLIFIYLN